MPIVLNKYKMAPGQKGIYCGRPSKFGNPFTIGRDGNRAEVIAKHKEWFFHNTKLQNDARTELRGENLICFCAPLPCHCDLLILVANCGINGPCRECHNCFSNYVAAKMSGQLND